jgi:uncharacterized integral membrane protein
MKHQRYIWLALIFLALLLISIYAAMNPVFPFNYVLWIAGVVVLLIAVLFVLQKKRKSKKTFKDWYEDDPRDPK